jgi:hypothetical protein
MRAGGIGEPVEAYSDPHIERHTVNRIYKGRRGTVKTNLNSIFKKNPTGSELSPALIVLTRGLLQAIRGPTG